MLTKLPTKCIVALLAFVGDSHAFWRMSCSVIQTGRIDPIVSPGKLASHAHKISGASNIGLSSTFDELQTANCTSCEIQADKSAYWTPLLYYQHSNGSFKEVVAPGMAVYYLGRGDTTSDIKPFPPGFRMLSGDALARSYNKSAMTYNNTRPIADRVSFACLDTAPKAETPGMSDTTCKNGLRAQVHFQSCWNGKDLYKHDNSHVAYMSGIDNGECPPTHPVHFMHVFFEVLYSVGNIQQDGGRFVFANGDPTGFGFHGDFLNGWSPSVLTSAIQSCGINNLNPSGVVKSCPAFTSDTDNYAQTCPSQAPLVKEPTTGTIAKLPGCITITDGPEEAAEKDIVCGAGSPQPAVNNPSIGNATSPASNLSSRATVDKRIAVRAPAASSGMPLPSTTNSTVLPIGTAAPSNSTTPSNTTAPTNSTTPSIPNPINGYVAAGCYADPLGTILSGGSHYTDSTALTVESCTLYCAKGGLPVAGVEGGKECWCAMGLDTTALPVLDALCDVSLSSPFDVPSLGLVLFGSGFVQRL